MIVRADLPRGIQAAQIVHAAGESSPGDVKAGTYAVVLSVPDETACKDVAVHLARAGVACALIFEPDPPYAGALMAIGLVPKRKEVLRRLVSSLPLLK